MSDIKLLKDAAKAAEWLVVGETNKMVCSENDLSKGGLCIRTGEGFDLFWNPLTDDGDALRLAVKLKITPHIDGNLTDCEDCIEGHFCDPYAATRLAIVRAAAEIGKTK